MVDAGAQKLQVIKVIRASKNKQDSIENLVKEFDFNFEQAKYIVEMQLYRLTNTDILDVTNEMEELRKNIAIWTQILNNEDALKHVGRDAFRNDKHRIKIQTYNMSTKHAARVKKLFKKAGAKKTYFKMDYYKKVKRDPCH